MDEERKRPHEPFAQTPKPKPIVANPSVPGVQPTNRPDGRSMPRDDSRQETRNGRMSRVDPDGFKE